jgi:hypothetical protein
MASATPLVASAAGGVCQSRQESMALCRGLNAGSGSVGLLSLVFTSVARTALSNLPSPTEIVCDYFPSLEHLLKNSRLAGRSIYARIRESPIPTWQPFRPVLQYTLLDADVSHSRLSRQSAPSFPGSAWERTTPRLRLVAPRTRTPHPVLSTQYQVPATAPRRPRLSFSAF